MRQNMKKAIAMAVIGALAFTGALGNNVTSEAKAKTKKIVMNKKKVTLKVGKTFKLKVKKVKPAKASKAVTYKSSKKKVATVSKKGVIKAKKVGSAKITVTSKKNKKAKATVKVTVKKASATKVTPTTAPSNPTAAVASATPAPTNAPGNQGNPTAGPATNAPDPTTEPDSTLKPTKTPKPSASPSATPYIVDLPEYQFDIKEELWTNGFYERQDNADGSITLTRGKGDADWQVGEFGFSIPRDKVGDLHQFTEIIVKYRDSDLTDDSTKCGYVFHMGDDTEPGWIESEDGGHPNTLSFNGTGQTSIYAGETLKTHESELNFSTIRIFDGKLGGKITIESVTLGKGKPGVETPGIETPGIETPGTETPGNETGGTEKPTPTHNPEGPVTYNVNQEYENTEADKAWFLYQLENPIKIKKTDNVKVVLSSADLGESTVALSDSTKEAPANVQQEAPLVKNVTEAGEITLDVTSYFTHNYADISKVVVAIPAGKKVKVEKIIVTPTDDVALSVHGLTTVEKDATSELTAEIADADFDSIEWTSSAPGTVSVAQDSQDPKKAVVTGVAAGEADVTIKVTKDGKTVKEEIVKITVTKKVSGNVYSLDISGLKGYDKATGKVTLKDNAQMIQFPKDGNDPLVVNPGQKVKFTFDYEIPEGGNNIRGYLTAGVDIGTSKEGSQDVSEGKTITCTASGDKASTHLMIKGANYGNPNVILSGITMEFVE